MRSKVLTLALVLGVVVSAARPAGAQASSEKKAACAEAYEASQELRSSGKLVQAEEKLAICADDECPAFVRGDCVTWLEEVRADVASILVTAKDATGAETTKVRILRGEEVLAEELGADPIVLDPGKYTLRFELEGAEPIVKNITLKKGKKEHAVELTFVEAAAEATPDVPPVVPAAPSEDTTEPAEDDDGGKPGKLRPFAYIAGGVGALGLVSWAVFGAIGSGEEADLRDTCSPNCPQSEVDAVASKYLIADISLGLGLAGLGTGVALFFLSQPDGSEPSADQARVGVDFRAAPGGGYASVNGRF